MKNLTAAIVFLSLGLALNARGADEAEEARAAPSARVHFVQKPRGVCHVSQPGLSLVIDDTTEEACRDRETQCKQDHPGHETGCRSQWTRAETKAGLVKVTKKNEGSGNPPGEKK